MTVQEALKDAEQKMQGAVSVTQDELGSIRTGRANPKLLERLHVDYYGTQVPLLQLASTSKAVSRAFNDRLAEAGGSVPTWLILSSLKGDAWRTQLEAC